MHLYKKMIYLLILLLVVTSCSSTDKLEPIKSQEQSMLNEKNKEISLGKYESPNGNDYQLFQIGTGFYYVDNENKHSNIFSNTGTLIKFILLESSKIYGEQVKFDWNNFDNSINGGNFECTNTCSLKIIDRNGISKSFSIKNIDILPEDFLSGCGSNSAGINCFIDTYNEKQQTFNINYESISGGVSKIFSFDINTGILKLTSSKENEPYDRSNELNNNYLPESFGDL